MASNEIHQVFQDGEGWLWLLTVTAKFGLTAVQQISLLNPRTGEVQTLEEHFGKEVHFNAKDIEHAAINEERKTIFLGAKEERVFIYEKGKSFKVITKEGWKDIYPWQSATDQTLLVQWGAASGSSKLYEMTFDGKILYSRENESLIEAGSAPPDNIFAFTKPNADHSMDLVSFQSKSEQKTFPLHPSLDPLICDDWSCRIYYKNDDQTFWYKSASRFFVFDPNIGVLFDFEQAFPEISKNVIQDVYFDKMGRSWVSTTQGLYIIQLTKNPFRRYLYNPLATYDINNFISCRGILEQQGVLWLGTESQRNFKINLSTSQKELLPYFEVLNHQGIPVEAEGRVVIKMGIDHLLFGDTHLMYYQISNASYQNYYWEEGHFPPIWSLHKDQHETIWTGTYSGPLGFWKQGMDSIQIYKHWNEFKLPANGYIYTFLDLDKDNLLVGTSSGIYQLNHQKGIINRYWTGGSEGDYLPHDQIYHLAKDKEEEGVIWIATGGGGLIRAEIKGQENQILNSQFSILNYKQFTIANGFSNNTIYAVYEDDTGNLWLPSDYGIIQFNKNTHFTKAYLEKDGIAYNEFNRISHYQDAVGNLYFGSLNGVTAFNPNDLTGKEDTLNIPLRITSFQQFDGEANKIVDKTAELSLHPSITLQPNDRFFRLDFALLEYQDASQIRYAYKMEGQEDEWTLTKDNNLRISGLPYGKLTLRVKGQSANGQFSADELAIPITVLRPFYATWWFKGFWMLVLLVGGPMFYKWRIAALKKRQLELEGIVEERTETIQQQNNQLRNLDKVKSRFFSNVSHELRTPLTLILGPLTSMLKSGSLTERNSTFAELGRKNAKNLLNLVNEILDLTKMESGKIELVEEETEFYGLLHFIVSAFEGMAQQKSINYHFDYQADQELRLLLDVKKFEKLVNNLLSNAFKFTPHNGSIILTVSSSDQQIDLSVKDTGRGIHPGDVPHVFDRYYQSAQPNTPKEGGTGIGLSLSHEIAKLMQGRLWVESTVGTGSTFHFVFPKKVVDQEQLERNNDKLDAVLASVPLGESDINSNEELDAELEIATAITGEVEMKPATLLLVEDNDNLREYIQLIVGEKHKVITAENGKVAWELLNSAVRQFGSSTVNIPEAGEDCRTDELKTVDLIISDIMMPEMDGYQLLEKLKGADRFRATPVIMLTALADLKDKLKALRIGVDDYMLKPFEEEELLARIDNLLHNSRQRKAFYQQAIGSQIIPPSDTSSNESMEQLNNEAMKPWNHETITQTDLEWLEELEQIVQREIPNTQFTITQLAHEMAMSKRNLELKIKSLTGLSPSKYIQEIRFSEARTRLESGEVKSIKVLAYQLGMKDTSHFSKLYKQRFGRLPSEYLEK